VKTVADIGTDMLFIITSISDKFFIGVNVDDLEPSKWVFIDFCAISVCDTHFKSKMRRNEWRWTWTNCV